MRALQKLTRNGNATALTIPRTILTSLGWLPGESMLVETTEEGYVLIRRPVPSDFAAGGPSRVLPPQPSMVKA